MPSLILFSDFFCQSEIVFILSSDFFTYFSQALFYSKFMPRWGFIFIYFRANSDVFFGRKKFPTSNERAKNKE